MYCKRGATILGNCSRDTVYILVDHLRDSNLRVVLELLAEAVRVLRLVQVVYFFVEQLLGLVKHINVTTIGPVALRVDAVEQFAQLSQVFEIRREELPQSSSLDLDGDLLAGLLQGAQVHLA